MQHDRLLEVVTVIQPTHTSLTAITSSSLSLLNSLPVRNFTFKDTDDNERIEVYVGEENDDDDENQINGGIGGRMSSKFNSKSNSKYNSKYNSKLNSVMGSEKSYDEASEYGNERYENEKYGNKDNNKEVKREENTVLHLAESVYFPEKSVNSAESVYFPEKSVNSAESVFLDPRKDMVIELSRRLERLAVSFQQVQGVLEFDPKLVRIMLMYYIFSSCSN